jgi:hypothetical protein
MPKKSGGRVDGRRRRGSGSSHLCRADSRKMPTADHTSKIGLTDKGVICDASKSAVSWLPRDARNCFHIPVFQGMTPKNRFGRDN